MNSISLKLKRHETFSIREGWIEKGINKCKNNRLSFQKENGTRVLGLGSNMVKSLKYWLQACRLVEFTSKGAEFLPLGDLIYNYDKFLENSFSWWLIHLSLSTNFDDAPVFNSFFNMPYSTFDKETIIKYLKDFYLNNNYEIGAESSLDSDVMVLLKSYYADDDKNPEDNTNCPLARLGLLRLNEKRTFSKVVPSYYSIDYRIVYYSILLCFNCVNNESFSFNLEDLYSMDNSPLKILNISKSMLFEYLEEMKKNNYINLVKTAGLNTIYIDKVYDLSYLFESYFKKKGE